MIFYSNNPKRTQKEPKKSPMKLSEFFSNLQITEKPVRQPEKPQKPI
jgi:hypothetical protein